MPYTSSFQILQHKKAQNVLTIYTLFYCFFHYLSVELWSSCPKEVQKECYCTVTQVNTWNLVSWPARKCKAGYCTLACWCNTWHNRALHGNCHIKKSCNIYIYSSSHLHPTPQKLVLLNLPEDCLNIFSFVCKYVTEIYFLAGFSLVWNDLLKMSLYIFHMITRALN